MHIHSVDDLLARFHGGYGRLGSLGCNLGNPDVETMLGRWRSFDRCPSEAAVGPRLDGAPGSADAGNSATRYVWSPCAQGTEIVLWKLTGSGHVWPGAALQTRFLGQPTTLINADDELWHFFSKFSRPQTR